MIRNPAVAGQFYPGTKNSLLREVESLIDSRAGKIEALGVVSPHAGYAYSGSVAGSVLSMISPRDTYVIIGPNHTGLGKGFGVDTSSAWRTPLGDVEIDTILADEIRSSGSHIIGDNLCHSHEHSIEVQIPFLQALQNDFKIVPIVASYAPVSVYREIGLSIARAIVKLNLKESVTIIASSDMTHYEPQESAKKKDSIAIEAILALDEDRLVEEVSRLDISMCGCGPTVIMLSAVKKLGAKSARLVRYQTSGDTTGDYSSVVGYAGILIE